MRLDAARLHAETTRPHHPHDGAHALLEFHDYPLFDTLHRFILCLMFAYD